MSRFGRALAGTALAISGCQEVAPSQKPLLDRIGVIAPLSGETTNMMAEIRTRLERRLQESEEKVELVWKDGACNFEEGRKAAWELKEEGVRAIIGGFCSAESLGALSVTEEAHLPMLSPSANGPELESRQNSYRYFYTLADGPRRIGKLLGEYISAQGIPCVDIYTDDQDQFSHALRQGFEASIDRKNIVVRKSSSKWPKTDQSCAVLLNTVDRGGMLRVIYGVKTNQPILVPNKETIEDSLEYERRTVNIVSTDPPEEAMEITKRKAVDALKIVIEALAEEKLKGTPLNQTIQQSEFTGESGTFHFDAEGKAIYEKVIFESH